MHAFDPADITLAVLAGGEGRRVGGVDKGLLDFMGKPLIAHVLHALRAQVGTVLICANRNAERYARHAPVVADVRPGFRGPLAGIATALAVCGTPWLLTVPVDCPHPPRDLALRLHAALTTASAAVAAQTQTREPVFAMYARHLAASAAAALECKSGVWRWQDEIGAVEVDFSDAATAFANMNAPQDFPDWQDTQHE